MLHNGEDNVATPRTLLVTVPGMIDDSDLEPLRAETEVVYHEVAGVSEDTLVSLCAGYDYLMLNYDVIKKLSPQFYMQATVRKLKAVSVDITGMDWASPESAVAEGIHLMNIPHYSTESVAETYLAEVLLHSRQRHLAYVDLLHGRPYQERKGINLAGHTAGVIGLGSIGSRVAELLEHIGMDVVAWNRTPRQPYRLVSLAELFDTSQVVCICLKTVREGDDRNVGIVDAELLQRSRDTIVINLANRDLVNHDAMAHALRGGQVAAYSVEHSTELESQFAGIEQVHLPPANSWLSDESLQMLREVWVRNILDAIDGRYPNLVRR
jgi:phosphoglycerate dehydrogenase-like enzyme